MKFDNVKSNRAEDLKTSVIELPLGGTIIKFTCRYFDPKSAEYGAVMTRISRPYRRRIDAGTLDPKTDRKIVLEAFCEHVLLDWEGVTSEGAEIAYTPERAVELFTLVPTLFYDLQDDCKVLQHFQPTAAEVKN